MSIDKENINRSFFSFKSMIGILISMVCLLILYNNFDWILFVKQITNTNYYYLSISVFCLFVSLFIRAFRWRLLFSDKVSLVYLYKSETLGFWGNSLFPLRMGELIKIHYAKVLTSKSYALILSTIIFERLVDLFFIFPFAIIFYFIFPMDIINEKVDFLFISIFILFCLTILILMFLSKIKQKIYSKISIDLLSTIYYNKILILASTFFIWFLIFLDVYFVQLSMKLNFNVFDNISIMLLATIIYVFPSSPGSIGTFHIAIQEFMVRFLNYPMDVSIAFAFILHAHSYLFFILLGTWYFLADSRRILSYKGKNEIY